MSHDIAWNGAHALRGAVLEVCADRAAAAPPHAPAADIVIESLSAARLSMMGADWRDLLTRAETANIFMHPALLAAGLAAYPERRIVTLAAWQRAPGTSARLVGLWAFARGRAPQSVLPLDMLSAPPTPNAYLATPVIDRACVDATLDAFLSYIAGDARLPNIIALDAMGADTATGTALDRLIAARGSALRVFGRSQRPLLASVLDGKAYFEQAMSASSRKKLRQHRRRLGETGALASIVVAEPDAVRRAFEDFLALEAAGWKGRQGTALLSNAADAAFARTMIGNLAAQCDATIHSLTLDGKPVSMQIMLRSGAAAFTWKTAFDEALHDFSPGTLLFEDYTTRLLADETIERVDSCSFDDSGYMATWQERAQLMHLWFDARVGGSPAFTLLARLQAAYFAARTRAKTVYRRHLRHKGR